MQICYCAEYITSEGRNTISCHRDIYRCRNHQLIYIRDNQGVTVLGRDSIEFEKWWFYGY